MAPHTFDDEWAELLAGLTDVDALAAAAKLRERIDHFRARAKGRVRFCVAMELYVLGGERAFDKLNEAIILGEGA
jgi:hypothetical protein